MEELPDEYDVIIIGTGKCHILCLIQSHYMLYI